MHNALIIMCDQMNFRSIEFLEESGVELNALKRIAAKGVRYKNAFTPHPLCVPARVSLWSSQYSHTHGSRNNQTFMQSGTVNAMDIWKQNGYVTGLIGKNHCFLKPEQLENIDIWCEVSHRGIGCNEGNLPIKGMDWIVPEAMINEAHSTRTAMPKQSGKLSYAITDHPLEGYSSALVAAQTEAFLTRYADGEYGEEPFGLWLSFPDPHTPFEVPREYFEQLEDLDVSDYLKEWQQDRWEAAPVRNQILHALLGIENENFEDVAATLKIYLAMMLFLDESLCRVLDALEETGLAEKTVLCFCSDHGDLGGEHGMFQKGGVFYDSLTHVPLIFSAPGGPEGVVSENLVSLIDIIPTVLTLQGIPLPESFQGRLLPEYGGEIRNEVFSEYGSGGPLLQPEELNDLPQPLGRDAFFQCLRRRENEGERRMVRTKKYKYVTDPMGDRDELYDLTEDPREFQNVADKPESGEVVRDLGGRLIKYG